MFVASSTEGAASHRLVYQADSTAKDAPKTIEMTTKDVSNWRLKLSQ